MIKCNQHKVTKCRLDRQGTYYHIKACLKGELKDNIYKQNKKKSLIKTDGKNLIVVDHKTITKATT